MKEFRDYPMDDSWQYLMPKSGSGKYAAAISIVPECFRLVDASAELKVYKSLREHLFTEEEKLFMCQQIRSADNTNAFELLLEPTGTSVAGKPKFSHAHIADRYSLSRSLLKTWLGKFDKGLKMYSRAGQPPIVDNDFIQSVRAKLATVNGSTTTTATTTIPTEEMINKLHLDKLDRDGRFVRGGYLCKKRKRTEVLSTGEKVTSVETYHVPYERVFLSNKSMARIRAKVEQASTLTCEE